MIPACSAPLPRRSPRQDRSDDQLLPGARRERSGDAHQQAIIALSNTVKRHALVTGFSDAFAVIGVVLMLSGNAILLTGKPKGGAATAGGH
jgi:hypothetical protein